MRLLDELGIKLLPPTDYSYKIRRVIEEDLEYYFAHIYEQRNGIESFCETLFDFTPKGLETQLKSKYGINMQLNERAFNGFVRWYNKKFGKLTPEQMWNIYITRYNGDLI
jgi:hypothetical protein